MKVVQCWDDGVVNDERLTELLRKYQAKATFNLNPGLMQEERIPSSWNTPNDTGWSFRGYRGGKLGLKEIAKIYDGFELASHCWRHENADAHPVETFVNSALNARHYLEDIVQKSCLGFAWPCGRTTPESAVAMREAGFIYGRTTGRSDDVTAFSDPMLLAASCHFLDNDFWGKYCQAKANNGVFYFWGHSYELMEYDRLWSHFEDGIKYISEDPEVEWANVIDIV